MKEVESEQLRAQKPEGRSAYFKAFIKGRWAGSNPDGNLTDVVGKVSSTHVFPAKGSVEVRSV